MTHKLGTLVWDIIAELSHRGEETLDPDSAQCAALRRAAYIAAGNKGNDRNLVSRVVETFTFGWLGQLFGVCGPTVAVA